MLLRRLRPGGMGVVDQNIDIADALQGLGHQLLQIGFQCAVGRHPARINADGLQLGSGGLQFVGQAIAQHDARACLAQGLRHLQPQTSRASGDEGGFAGEVKQLLDGLGHLGKLFLAAAAALPQTVRMRRFCRKQVVCDAAIVTPVAEAATGAGSQVNPHRF